MMPKILDVRGGRKERKSRSEGAKLWEELKKGEAEGGDRGWRVGGTLGRLVSVTTQGQFSPMPLSRARVAYQPQAATPINPGEITVDASVTGRWQFVAP